MTLSSNCVHLVSVDVTEWVVCLGMSLQAFKCKVPHDFGEWLLHVLWVKSHCNCPCHPFFHEARVHRIPLHSFFPLHVDDDMSQLMECDRFVDRKISVLLPKMDLIAWGIAIVHFNRGIIQKQLNTSLLADVVKLLLKLISGHHVYLLKLQTSLSASHQARWTEYHSPQSCLITFLSYI